MYYKVTHRFHFSLLTLLLFLLAPSFTLVTLGQTVRPPVTSKFDEYKKQVKSDASKKMVELKTIIPSLVYDLRYATTNNFMRRLMYPAGTNQTYLRKPAALALLNVQTALSSKGVGLKVYDAYRPYAVTVKFWELVHDERFVANPKNGSGHNRGVAIDLTIIDSKTKAEVNMGTGFDNFSDTAHQGFIKLPQDVLENRKLLKTTMEKYGFKPYADEWWHYSWPEAAKFEILDIDFKKLKKAL
ncbi:MAG: hypothetical protein RIR12_2267 [Bacteroidota bacterium]|jgi:D-alanyl-D-alanine dipeptidase